MYAINRIQVTGPSKALVYCQARDSRVAFKEMQQIRKNIILIHHLRSMRLLLRLYAGRLFDHETDVDNIERCNVVTTVT